MIRFDWEKVIKKSKGNINSIINIFYWLTYKEVPYNNKEPIYKIFTTDYNGSSFILNPYSLFYYKKVKFSKAQMVDYIYLASYRNYINYYMLGETFLPREQSPFELNRVKNNPLFILTHDNIKLKLEDNKLWH